MRRSIAALLTLGVRTAVTAFGLLTALDGDLTVRFAGGQLTLRKGESAYIPHTAPVLTLGCGCYRTTAQKRPHTGG